MVEVAKEYKKFERGGAIVVRSEQEGGGEVSKAE